MRFKLIIATVKTDVTDSIVDAAKAAGATGATVTPRARYRHSGGKDLFWPDPGNTDGFGDVPVGRTPGGSGYESDLRSRPL